MTRAPTRDAVSVSVVVPAFDEERRIARAIRSVTAALEDLGTTFEVFCVDDGSADSTAAAIDAIARRDPRVRLLRLRRHRGKGAAVRAGMLSARGDAVFFLDADLSTPASALADALPLLDAGADIVRGSRRCAGARVLAPQSRVRVWLGRTFQVLARAIADPDATDLTCGFKGFRRESARAVFGRCRQSGWAFDVEAALIARRLGYVTREIPVDWTNDRDSRVRLPAAIVESLIGLVRVVWRDLRVRRGALEA